MNRRQFLSTSVVATAALNTLGALQAQSQQIWGGPVLDIHLHAGQNPERVFNHVEGSGETRAVLLPGRFEESAKAAIAAHPGRFVRFASADITKPDAVAVLTKSLKEGAIGIGEIKYHVTLDGPEMRKVYDLAAEARVPVTVHFQEIPHFDGEGIFNTGFPRLGDILKAYPRTTILGHADAFWANVSADVSKDIAYPGGRIKPGGLSDKWLAEFPNLYGDMSANSCNTALYRDPDFMRGFLDRHQDKLIFGSDCPCTDGHGTGVTAEFVPRTTGKCLARETLTLLKQLTTPEVFRKITWTNGVKLLKLNAA
jgi:predicted TIM-barrel fold metal-dependent hydrolase